MAAEDLAVLSNGGGERHILKGLVDLGKARVCVIDVFSESLRALSSKAEEFVDVLVLVVASEQDDLLGELQLESKEKANDFETVVTLVHVVSQEYVVLSLDISLLTWSLPNVEESHQIDVLPVQVAKHFGRWSDVLDHDGLSSQHLENLTSELNDVLPLARELGIRLEFLAFLWFQERLEEHLAEGVVRVLVDLGVVPLVRVELLRLFGQLVNRDLSNNHREVLSVMLWNIATFGGLSSNHSMGSQLESLVHGVDVSLVLLDGFLFILLAFFALVLSRLDLLKQRVVSGKKLLSVDLADLTKWNVGDFMLETAVHIDTVVAGPAAVSESLHRVELVPL